MAKWIGLTGGLASGKSTVAQMLRARGVTVIDADAIAHEALAVGQEPYRQVLSFFGTGILFPDQSLDRIKLAGLVFRDSAKLHILESWVHPYVQAEVQKQRTAAEKRGEKFVIYDVPLLFEKKMQDQFDEILVVNCSEDSQISRAQARTGMSKEDVVARLSKQIPLKDKVREADRIFTNEGTLKELEEQVETWVQKMRSLESKT